MLTREVRPAAVHRVVHLAQKICVVLPSKLRITLPVAAFGRDSMARGTCTCIDLGTADDRLPIAYSGRSRRLEVANI